MNLLRLSSSSAVLTALRVRAITSPKFVSRSISITTAFCARFQDLKNPICFPKKFSTDAKSNPLFVKALDAEIKSKQLSFVKTMPQPPADFPFAIQDDSGKNTLELTRELDGEEIYVSVAMPEFKAEVDEDESCYRCSECGRAAPVNLYVRITKKKGKMVAFGVSVSADEMNVSLMSAMCSGMHNVDTVSSDLQSALREYLEIRGVRKSDVLFLYKYMVKKSKRDPLVALEMLKKFVEE